MEEPGGVVRRVRRLVRPVFDIGIGHEPDVRHEYPDVQIDPVPHVPVVSAVCLADVPVRVSEIELSPVYAEVVPGNAGCARAELEEQPPAHVVVVEIAADPHEREIDLPLAERGGGADIRVVDWSVEGVVVVDVHHETAGKHL